MKKSRFTEEQILYAIRQVEAGTPPADVCRQLGEFLPVEEALREARDHGDQGPAPATR